MYCSFFIPWLLRYSSTFSTGVSSFFPNVPGVLFFCVSVQGVEVPALIDIGLV